MPMSYANVTLQSLECNYLPIYFALANKRVGEWPSYKCHMMLCGNSFIRIQDQQRPCLGIGPTLRLRGIAILDLVRKNFELLQAHGHQKSRHQGEHHVQHHYRLHHEPRELIGWARKTGHENKSSSDTQPAETQPSTETFVLVSATGVQRWTPMFLVVFWAVPIKLLSALLRIINVMHKFIWLYTCVRLWSNHVDIHIYIYIIAWLYYIVLNIIYMISDVQYNRVNSSVAYCMNEDRPHSE